jgi:atypical dual specificity phosphatase
MSEIIKNKLYLGNLFDANNKKDIKKNKITTIICVAEGIKIIKPEVKVYSYNIQDDYKCNISLYFDEIGEIINKEKTVLVNCIAGISRSSTIVISYIMKYFNLNLRDTFLLVRSKSPLICPNKEFMKYLLEYELKIFGENSLKYDECINLFYYT